MAAMTLALALAPGLSSPVEACGLEFAYAGGLTVSYPGALEVAVAVADSRRAGVLPPARPGAVSNMVLLQRMLADLRRLQSRLRDARAQGQASFSLVLVGPGLWSHYHLTSPGGVLARYHTDGPLNGKAVVMTHYAVLRALLNGDLDTAEAAELGLIAYSGRDMELVRSAFETGFRSSS